MGPSRLALAAALAVALAPTAARPTPSPVLHLGAGTGFCEEARSPTSSSGNPCWLFLDLGGALRFGPVEVGLVYQGRDVLSLLTLFQLHAPSASVVGATAGLVVETSKLWRLSVAGEAGWRRYADFAGSGLHDRSGSAVLSYAGLTGRVGLGLRPERGRAERMELTLAWRQDLRTTTETVEGEPWELGGWSLTMAVGLVADW
jgi:hypothetical protein